MGIFKILGCVALGVGAVAAAPFTGGGSVLGAASLAASLAGTGTVAAAAAAGVAGGVAGAVWDDTEEESRRTERKEAHEGGFNQGVKQGNIETTDKFLAMLMKNDNYRIGIFALAVCVANKDNDFSEAERREIECYLGRPDSPVNKNVRDKFKEIYENVPSFTTIKAEYLDVFTNADLEELNGFVMAIIEADGKISVEEEKFIAHTWGPYLQERGIA